jgi:hypothetical protein
MPCGAEKTSRDPSRPFGAVAPDLRAIALSVAAVDKSQVFAIGLIRLKLLKNWSELIRRKFSIDIDPGSANCSAAVSTISKP